MAVTHLFIRSSLVDDGGWKRKWILGVMGSCFHTGRLQRYVASRPLNLDNLTFVTDAGISNHLLVVPSRAAAMKRSHTGTATTPA